MTDTERAYADFRVLVDSLEADEKTERVDLSRDFAIDCPDCGRQMVASGKCPKCGGESWVPAGKRFTPAA